MKYKIKVFILILVIIVILPITYYFYINLIAIGPSKPPESILIPKFEKDLIRNIEVGSSYGSIRVETFKIDFKIDTLCFSKSGTIKGTYDNIEKISLNNPLFIVDDNFCVSPESGRIKLRFEGLGDKAKISLLEN